MLDEQQRCAIALKRFSLISPIVNGQVKSSGEYTALACKNPLTCPITD